MNEIEKKLTAEVRVIRSDGMQVGIIERAVTQHAGWQSVNYGGFRYELLGGIVSPPYIKIGREIKGDI